MQRGDDHALRLVTGGAGQTQGRPGRRQAGDDEVAATARSRGPPERGAVPARQAPRRKAAKEHDLRDEEVGQVGREDADGDVGHAPKGEIRADPAVWRTAR